MARLTCLTTTRSRWTRSGSLQETERHVDVLGSPLRDPIPIVGRAVSDPTSFTLRVEEQSQTMGGR